MYSISQSNPVDVYFLWLNRAVFEKRVNRDDDDDVMDILYENKEAVFFSSSVSIGFPSSDDDVPKRPSNARVMYKRMAPVYYCILFIKY